MFLRNDTPGCVRREKGDTFSEIYLSYLSGPKGVCIPSSEFFTRFCKQKGVTICPENRLAYGTTTSRVLNNELAI